MKVQWLLICGLMCAFTLGGPIQSANARTLDTELPFQFAAYQLGLASSLPDDDYPQYVDEYDDWYLTTASSWTCGFFPQCYWALYERFGDSNWLAEAQARTAPIEYRKYDTGTHDLGFVLFNSFGYGYKLTGDAAYKNVCLRAASSLATRYNANVGAIKSWDFQEPFPVIIDNMMNLELLFWSAANGGPATHYDMAVQHALTTAREHVRDDGSSYHVVDFDPITGLPAARPGEPDPYRTHQGYSDESTWARGQAWGIYGFSMCYRESGDVRFLDTAKLMADWFIDHLPADNVPAWDFDVPLNASTARDTSAAAVAASGMVELSTFVAGPDRKKYLDAAEAVLTALCTQDYLALGSSSPSILLRGTYNFNAPKGVDVGLVWGDSYFLEALLRYEDAIASLLPGDADRDGDVDLGDFVILKTNFGASESADWTEGDFNGDGGIDLNDFVILKTNFGSAVTLP